MLKLCLAKLEELDSIQVDLKINYHDLSPSCWRKKWDHIKKVQVRCLSSSAHVNYTVQSQTSVGKEFFPLGGLFIAAFALISLAMIHCNCNN